MHEADLIARVVLHDDHHAFAQLVRLHQSPLRLYLRRLTCGDEAWADDLAQDTFVRGYEKVRSFRNDAPFRTWLFSIATNLFRSETRRKRRQLEEVSAEPPADASSTDNPEREALAGEVLTAMERLRDEERIALSLCSAIGLSHGDAAAIMECPVGTVKTHLLRGKERLRTLLNRGTAEARDD